MSPSLIPQPFGSGYNVQLPSFQGPLELLLSLIEQNRLDISSISLMVVTEQYLRSVERLEVVDPGALADFLVVASRLLYIKSYSLLPKPRPPVEDEEEASGEALVRQLLEYRRFKEIAATLKEREEQGLRLFVRTAPVQDLPRRLDLTDVDVELLNLALRQALQAGKLARAGGTEAAKVQVLLENGQTYGQTARLLFTDLSVDPATGKSVIADVRTTCLPKYMERSAYLLTFWKLGKYYRTYPAYVEDEVKAELTDPARQFERGPRTTTKRGTDTDDAATFVVEDGRYVSARWPGDAYRFARAFLARL